MPAITNLRIGRNPILKANAVINSNDVLKANDILLAHAILDDNSGDTADEIFSDWVIARIRGLQVPITVFSHSDEGIDMFFLQTLDGRKIRPTNWERRDHVMPSGITCYFKKFF